MDLLDTNGNVKVDTTLVECDEILELLLRELL